MDNSCHTLPRLSPCPIAFGGPFSPSLPSHHISLPLSPICFPPSPTSLSPATADSLQSSSSPLSDCTASHHLEGGPPAISPSYQDDLTCLSWLHQRGNLLPLQPLSKATPPLLQLESASQHPASAKPPYSFSSLIFMAIEDSPDKRLPVKDIYGWIVDNFPYYRTASAGWRNSVRHNLSLSKSFCRIERDKSQSVGKGSLWCVSPEHRAALLEVLRKIHTFHSTNRNLVNKPALLEGADYGMSAVCDSMEMSDSLPHSLMLTPTLASDNPAFDNHPDFPLTPDHEELVAIEPVEYRQEELSGDLEKDPLADSGYIELHYYQSQEYQYLVLPDDTELDLETVEILQLDADAQEAAGSLLDLAGGGY
ncbi:forkhead box protein N2-like [Dunckerocampus dactyliophorus]|uniref:forkhead box protein N2-like n=1 Tax=Dunckerocampus dactyliophorus TaxID=161453 RepID=UPI002405708F|nr:forkhead box protein N2-like [Dunckerocampus dactyliophorus]XP_054648052.1 forkhead box protein N2-like [Dunckerocampus dactyliophorus]